MYKPLVLLLVMSILFCQEAAAFPGYIFEEEKGAVLVGGYAIEAPRYEITGDSKNLKKKLYWITTDGVPNLFFEADVSIVRFEMSNAGYVAVNKAGYKLDILSPDGVLVRSFDGVMTMAPQRVFSWSPDGRKIAFIEAQKTEGIVSYIPKGVYIFDVEKNIIEKISDFAVELNWSRHDGNIYMQGTFGKNKPPEYLVYNPSQKTTGKAPHNSIYYSDSGRYSIIGKWDPDGSDNYLYSVQDGGYVEKKIEGNEPLYSIDYVYGFLPNKEVVFVLNWTPAYVVYNANDGKKIHHKAKTTLLGWNKTASRGVTYQGHDKIEIVDLNTGETLFEIELPK